MDVKRNIPLLFLVGNTIWIRFFIPILALLYIASEVPFEQFTLIMGIFSLVILLLEIPSGVVADLIGKSNVIFISQLLFFVEIFIIAFFNGFIAFFIAKMISGVAVSLVSGASDALFYDTLKKLKRLDEHKRLSGKRQIFQNSMMAVTFTIGAYLFTIDPKLPVKAALPLSVMVIILAFLLVEPYKPGKRMTLNNSWLQLKEGIRYFRSHDQVKYLALFSIPVISVVYVVLTISSVYFKKVLIPVAFIGAIAFLTRMMTALSSGKAYRIEKHLGDRGSLRLVQILLVVALILLAGMVPYFGALFFLLIPFAMGFFIVLMNHYLNSHIPTSHRATILSIRNMGDSIGVSLLFPVVGYFSKVFSMQAALIATLVIFVVHSILLLLYSRTLDLKMLHKPT